MEKNLVFTNKIDSHLKKNILIDYFKLLSEFTGAPIEIVKTDYKQFISRKHFFLKSNIERKINFLEILKSTVIYFATFFYVLIFSENNKQRKKVKIIFDEVFTKVDYEEIDPLIKKFPDHVFVSNQETNMEKQIKFNKRKGYNRNFIFSNLSYIFFKVIWVSIINSRKSGVNLIDFSNFVVNQILKYNTLFYMQKADILFQFRFYTTSAIRNYLFKKNGGKVCCTVQRILIHLGRTGYFIDTDIFFALGSKSANLINYTKSNFKKIIPVGSLIMEKFWLNQKKINTPKFDIVFIGGNHGTYLATDEKYMDNYFESLRWLNKISKKYPNLSICIKHHQSWNRDEHYEKEEDEILKGTSIQRLYKTEHSKFNKSYGFAFNAKICLTWNSTMVYELIGHNIPAYFLDPNLENDGWFLNSNYTIPWRLSSYEIFEKKIIDNVLNNKKDKIENPENFCLFSKKTSQNIYNFLKEF